MTPNEWILSDDTGISSKTIWAVMTGTVTAHGGFRVNNFYSDVPHDPSDFGRCYRLLKNFPSWRKRIGEMAIVSETWKKMADNWNDLESEYEREMRRGTGSAPVLFKKMQEIIRGEYKRKPPTIPNQVKK